MNKKKLAIGLAAGMATIALSVGASPAFAAIDFDSATWLVGGVNYQFEGDGSGDTYGGVEELTTPTQSNYELYYEEFYFYNGDFNSGDYTYCIGATATEVTESNGDVVITCEPYQIDTDSNIWATNSYRFYSDQMLTRHVVTIENKGTASFDLGDPYFYYYLSNYSKTASSSNPATCDSMTADDHWAITAGTADTIINGYAWQAAGSTTFTTAEEDCESDEIVASLTNKTMAAGEKRTYMSLIATAEPAGTSSGEMDTAFAAALTQMSSFDSLNDTFCRGIDGLVIDGWGTCAASLPDTGANSAVMGSSIAIGSGLLIAGALALLVVSRRQARS
jgi:hypothetical protein